MAKRNDANVMAGFRHIIDCHDEPVKVIALADLHIGDANVNLHLVKRLIEDVRTDPNLYCVLVGDLINNAVIGSPSDVYGETMRPSDQLSLCYDLLHCINNKILCITQGNHEIRSNKNVGVDLTRLLARELGCESVYAPEAALVFLTFGRDKTHCRPITYSMYVTHGHGGGGRKVGSKMNGLADYASIIDADVFVVGHTHLPSSFKQQSYRVNNASGMATLHEQLFVNTASALSYGGYGQRGGYQPGSNSYPIITLDNTKHHMTATV